MRPLAIVVVREVGELSLKVACGPKGHVIEEFPSDGSDEALDERVVEGHVWNCLNLPDLQNPKTGLPAVVAEQGIVIGAQRLWQRTGLAKDLIEHPAGDGTIDNPHSHGQPDDPSGSLIHYEHDPMGPEE